MSIKHAKVATVGLEAANPDQAGGDDWNEPHVYEAGAFVPVGVASFTYDFAGNTCHNNGAGAAGFWSYDGAGVFSAANPLTIPVRAGVFVQHQLLGVNVRGLPAGWSIIMGRAYAESGLTLTTLNTLGDPTRPPNNIVVDGLVVAMVTL